MNLKKLWYKFWLDRKIGKFHRQVDKLERQLTERGLISVRVKRWQSLVVCISCEKIGQMNKCSELLPTLGWRYIGSNHDGDLWKKGL